MAQSPQPQQQPPHVPPVTAEPSPAPPVPPPTAAEESKPVPTPAPEKEKAAPSAATWPTWEHYLQNKSTQVNQDITWDSDLSELSPNRDNYVIQAKWQCVNESRCKLAESEIRNLTITRLKKKQLAQKVPTPAVDNLAELEARAREALTQAMVAPRPVEVEARAPPLSTPPAPPLPRH